MASSSLAVRILPEAIRSLAFGSISGTYAAIGTPLAHPARIVLFQNDTDQSVFISWDGVTNHLFIPGGSFVLLDVGTNKGIGSEFAAAQNTQFYVAEVSSGPSQGSVYISVLYGKE